MRRLLLALKILSVVIACLIALLVGATLLLNSSSFQNKMMKRAAAMLSERLGTRVTIDSVYVSLLGQTVELYGIDVEDQQQRKMLQVEQLAAGLRLMALRHDEVDITKVSLKGCRALIVKADTDSVANFQFIVDSLSRRKPEHQASDTVSKPKKKLQFDVNNVAVDDIAVQYNDSRLHLGWLSYHHQNETTHTVEVRDVETAWKSKTKKGMTDNTVSLHALLFVAKDGRRQMTIENLHYKSDNHLPRKNHNKPKRGAFDVGHLDVTLQAQAMVSYADTDSLVASIKASAADATTGIDLKHIDMDVAANKRAARLSNVTIQQGRTTLKFDRADVTLPSKKANRGLSYRTSPVSGYVVLQDIARPFAPVLNKFTIPLTLGVTLSGDDRTMTFSGVSVTSTDKQLRIKADGTARNLNDSHQLALHFNVGRMYAQGNVKERILSQLPVKKLMMKELRALGDISYKGQFDILWRKEAFRGRLHTRVGNLDFHFAIDEANKYVSGTASSDALQVDKTFDLPDIGVAKCKADFKVDISKPRTARMRRQKGGKLPIGTADIQVEEVRYKKIPVRNIDISVNSDGAVAEGALKTNGHHIDLSCIFSFTSTDEMRKMKITKPKVKLHKLSDEDRQKKAEKKKSTFLPSVFRRHQNRDTSNGPR